MAVSTSPRRRMIVGVGGLEGEERVLDSALAPLGALNSPGYDTKSVWAVAQRVCRLTGPGFRV